jgi:polysaccharide biosynthesis protein PslH
MKILYINTFNPYKDNFGGAVVTRKELSLLKKNYDVDILFSETLFKRFFKNPIKIFLTFLKTRSLKLSSYAGLSKPLNFYSDYDVIFCNHDFSAIDYKKFLKLSKPFIIRKHNIEYKLINNKNLFSRYERRMLKNYELEVMSKASSVIHISPNEFELDNVSYKKFFVYPPLFTKEINKLNRYSIVNRDIDILCVSNFNWKPNKLGLNWFLNNVFNKQNKLNLHLVGKGSEYFNKYNNVVTHGYVDNLDSLYRRAKFFVVPIVSGAGIKIKLIEAVSKGLPIITTSKGLEGLEIVKEYVYIIDEETNIQDFFNIDENKLKNSIKCSYDVFNDNLSDELFLNTIKSIMKEIK